MHIVAIITTVAKSLSDAANFSDQIRAGAFSIMVVELLQEYLHTNVTCTLKVHAVRQ